MAIVNDKLLLEQGGNLLFHGGGVLLLHGTHDDGGGSGDGEANYRYWLRRKIHGQT